MFSRGFEKKKKDNYSRYEFSFDNLKFVPWLSEISEFFRNCEKCETEIFLWAQ